MLNTHKDLKKNIQTFWKTRTWSYQSQTPSPHCYLKRGSSWQPVVEREAEEKKSVLTLKTFKSVLLFLKFLTICLPGLCG